MTTLLDMAGDGLEFDTASLPIEERFSAWASAMPFYAVSTPEPCAFEARIRAWLLPPVIVVDAMMSEVSVARTDEHIRTDGRDDLVLQLLDGSSLVAEFEGEETVARSGEIVLHDRARAFSGVLSAGRNVTVSMPRAFLEERLPGVAVHGLVLRDGLALPLAAFLASLTQVLAADQGESGELARLLRDLVAAAVRRSAPASRQASDATLKIRAHRYIRQNLSAPLDVRSLCEALGVSRSRLYRAFERDGGVGRYVTVERLKRVHRLLSDPAERSSIAQLAAAHGFPDSAHFSRLFRRTFGYGPQALRRRAGEDAGTKTPTVECDPAPARFNRWEDTRA
ncbi:AraC family transcriptional regulator [Sphingomonas parva]|uniref:AraC family transcriptional regulator n=1 Tax=Sphingomonas parva TaxID=2555898 RepID=A0A4Y8ZSP6_9SPHN|nr:AraC family transcriptional regulator [Sphingomonas parva]TFI58135.1 AraC family transcriptional regulator [Sphingomonas parva]